MEGVKLERVVKAPGLESRRAGHAVLPQWRCTARPMVVNLTAAGDGDAVGEGMHGSVYVAGWAKAAAPRQSRTDLFLWMCRWLAVVSVHCGAEHTMALTDRGVVLGFGRGDSGQLGRGHLEQGNESAEPVRLMQQVAQTPMEKERGEQPKRCEIGASILAASGDRTACISVDDGFFSWGSGWRARRKPKSKPKSKPYKVQAMTKLCITELHLGDDLGIALDMVGQVYTFGGAEHAALGRRTAPPEAGFGIEKVHGFGPKGNTAVTSLACGSAHCIAVTSEGQPYGWGSDLNGQLGLGGPEAGNGSVVPTPVLISSFRGHIVEKVWCGGGSSFALTSNSSLFSWGSNLYGQLGQGHDRTSEPTPHSVVALDATKLSFLAVGRMHTLAVVDGTVWSWGRGCHGQLGTGYSPTMNRPRMVTSVDAAVKGATIASVSCGDNHSAALTKDGRIVTWGCNLYGQLGYPYMDPKDPYNPGIAQQLADAQSGRGTRRRRRRPNGTGGLQSANESVSDLDRRYSRYGGSLGGRLSTPQSLRWYHESMKKDESQHATVRRLRPVDVMKKSEAHSFVAGFVQSRSAEDRAERERVDNLAREERLKREAEEKAQAEAKSEAEEQARRRRQLTKTGSRRSRT